jgi:thymidylate synthase
LLEGTPAEFEYDYHGRLFAWGGDLGLPAFDQVAGMVARLGRAPTSRRAVAVTWEPPVDAGRVDVPCLQLVRCQVWNGRLEMQTVFRSNDICSALGANLYALADLQRSIAAALDLPAGEYTHIAFSPHVYLSDADFLRAFCQGSMEGIRPRGEVCDGCRARAGCGKRKAVPGHGG